ncbi:MAG: biotin transporter BioY [Gammaproteobacteria bacterium]
MVNKLQNAILVNHSNLVRQTTLTLIGMLVIAVSAQLSIPLQPVPLTFQGATVVLIGLAFGARIGASAVLTYLLAGALGAPVFANFSFGIHTLLGPTGGYLLGFLPAAALAGYLAESGFARNFLTCCLAALCSTAVLFTSGYFVLAIYIGFHKAFLFGIKPFVLVDSFKVVILSLLVPRFWKK